MPLFNAGQSLGLYRLGRQEAELRAEKARKLKEAAERKSAIQAVIDARMSGGLGSKVAPKQDAPAETSSMPGPVIGYGGGTYGVDGSQATPPRHFMTPEQAKQLDGYSAPGFKAPPVYDPNGSTPGMVEAGGGDNSITAPISAGSRDDAAKAAQLRLFAIDPDTAMQLEDHFAKADESARKAYDHKMSVMGSAAYQLRGMPQQQRISLFQRIIAPQLLAAGWTPEDLSEADLSDQGLDSYIRMSMDTKTIMSEARQRASDAETARHNKVSEAQGERRIGIAEGALGIAKQREGRIPAKGSGPSGDVSSLSTDAILGIAGLK